MQITSRQGIEDLNAFAPNHEVFSIVINAGDPDTISDWNKYSQLNAQLTREEFNTVLELISTFK